MNKVSRVHRFVLTAFLCSVFVAHLGCESSTKKSVEAPVPSTGWSAKMQALSTTLSELLPLVASRKKFADPKNAAAIEANTRALKTLAHSLKSGDQPSADPTMKAMTNLFDEDIARALEALQSGNRDYARHVLSDTTSYCIQCHTQTNNGPDFPRLNLSLGEGDLSPLDRAELFAATRQFDKALAAYIVALDDPKLAAGDPYEWEAAARSGLAITVRVKQTAKDTLAFIKALKKSGEIPKGSLEAVDAWEKSATEWSKEKSKDVRSPSALLAQAESIIKAAQKKQAFPLDHSQDVAYFRAGSLLHGLLQEKSTSAGQSDDLRARALYWAGVSSEATRDMNFWTLHETYYQQCIRLRPGTEQARQCFARLKESVVLGYSGSGGVAIPPEVQRRLDIYRETAEGPKP